MDDLTRLFNNLHDLIGYVARQTNPFTGAPLPQPVVGQGSVATSTPPPTSGQLRRGG